MSDNVILEKKNSSLIINLLTKKTNAFCKVHYFAYGHY